MGPGSPCLNESINAIPNIVNFVIGATLRAAAEWVCLGVSFSLQSAALMSGNSGTDARFPSKVRQNVVVG